MSEYLIYLRKSRQDDPSQTVEEVLAKHEIQLQDFALATFGYRIPENDIYREVVSGETIDDRPMINAVLKRIEDIRIIGVLVIEPQRLTRGDMLDCGTIVHLFRYSNTLIVTPSKNYDLADKFDRKLFEMELSRGSDYLEYTKEILARGRLASARRGNYAHSKPPYGYKRIKIGKDWSLVPDEETAPYVRKMFEMRLNGFGVTNIARTLTDLGAKTYSGTPFEPFTVRKILQNETYTGVIKIGNHQRIRTMEDGKLVKKDRINKNYEVVKGKFEPLVDRETFLKVNETNCSREKADYPLRNIFAGLLYCGKCGRTIKFSYERNQKRYKCITLSCDCRSSKFDVVRNGVIDALKKQLEDFETSYQTGNDTETANNKALIASLGKQVVQADKKLANICDYLENGIYTTEMFLTRKNALEEDKKRLLSAISSAKDKMSTTKTNETRIITLHQALDMLSDDSIPVKAKNEFLKSFIKKITYVKINKEISLEFFLK